MTYEAIIMLYILLQTTNTNWTWIDEYANTFTFWGLVVSILGIVLAIFFFFFPRKPSKQSNIADANMQQDILKKQNQALALEEQKMREEVKPLLYVGSNVQNRSDHWIKLTIGNNNRKGIARIIGLNRISEGWSLKKLPVNDITFTDSQIVVLEYSVGMNPDEFEIDLEIEDLYHNKYKARIIPAMSTISLSDYE